MNTEITLSRAPSAWRLLTCILLFGTPTICALRAAEDLGDPKPSVEKPDGYEGKPYQGKVQSVPGKLECELYDEGGEGVAYHETDGRNHGSGELNKSNSELDTFRKDEGVDLSYTKNDWDNSEFNLVQQELGRFYLGWTATGEWVRYTVDVTKAGHYSLGVMYTSRYGGGFSLECDGRTVDAPIRLSSTANDRDQRRNWHHWNYHEQEESVFLPAGRHVLTIKILDPGNLNLDRIDFTLAE